MQPARGNGAGTVLICGAGIAGTVVAYRLARAGLRPTVVERSADLRQAGNAVDLRGPALRVMADMGVLAELETRATQLSEFFRIDSSGKRVFTMAPHVIGGEIELLRTELNAVLFNAAQTGVEYRFGDSIRSLHERGDDVAVTFDSGRHGHFDVVIGADGLHSRTRTLAFGPESDFVRHLGCYQAHFTTGNVLGLRNAGLLLNRPGRTLGCYTVHQSRELVIGLFFESAQRAYDRADPAAQRHWIHRVFEGMGMAYRRASRGHVDVRRLLFRLHRTGIARQPLPGPSGAGRGRRLRAFAVFRYGGHSGRRGRRDSGRRNLLPSG